MEESRYVDIKLDFAFKHIFGRIENKDILASFLNAVLPDGVRVANILRIEESKILPLDKKERGVDYDILCVDDKDQQFIVEMQNRGQKYFVQRMLFYTSKAISNQGVKGKDWNYNLLPVHFVGVLNFLIENEAFADEAVVHIFLKNQENLIVTPHFSFTLVQLPLFISKELDVTSVQNTWLYLFRNLDKIPEMPANLKSTIFEEVFEKAEEFKMNPTTRKIWEEGIKRQRDLDNQIELAKMEGLKEGLLKGEKRGEKRERILFAKRLKAEGFTLSMIAKLTELSEKEIEAL
jgi:predicted transposase/invertase (TIGR01784 family)